MLTEWRMAYLKFFREFCWVCLNIAHPHSPPLVNTGLHSILLMATKWGGAFFRRNVESFRPHPLVAGTLNETTPHATPPMQLPTIVVIRQIPAKRKN